jgi:hypothetical protein
VARGSAVGSGTALPAGRSWDRFTVVSFQSIRTHFGPGVNSASNRNECQEYFLGGKDCRCLGLTSPPSCADCLKFWDPEPPGAPFRACPGLYRNCFTFDLNLHPSTITLYVFITFQTDCCIAWIPQYGTSYTNHGKQHTSWQLRLYPLFDRKKFVSVINKAGDINVLVLID